MRTSRLPLVATICLALISTSTVAVATDRPIAGVRLELKQSGAKQKLVFLSQDPGFLFPTIGGGDDPQLVGATVEIVPAPGSGGTLTLPPGAGKPGWTAKPTGKPSYKFENALAPNGISPVRVALLRHGRQLKILAKSTAGVSLTGTLTGIAIRITTGTIRNCALFGAATIRHQAGGSFVATHAPASALTDCSDASIGLPSGCDSSPFPSCGGSCPGDGVCTGGLGVCHCVSPSSPCGGTDPVCNGTCPVGEECVGVGPGYPSCVCLSAGATPCGSPGVPTCGGECPGGSVCQPAYALPSFGGGLGCACTPPGPCGVGGGHECGNGFACAYLPGPSAICAPINCGGTYPTCGGTCGDGGECQAVSIPTASFGACVCAVPAPCDSGCGGYTCPGAQVCTVDTSCSCQ